MVEKGRRLIETMAPPTSKGDGHSNQTSTHRTSYVPEPTTFLQRSQIFLSFQNLLLSIVILIC